MPYTIPDSFARLRSNIEITDIQSSVVSTRQQTIRRAVANGLTAVDDFLTGSYARSTMISPLSEADMDIFICLDPFYFHRFNNANGGPSGFLNLARQTIRQTYTTTPDISRNGQAVTIRFSDFVADVVIGFQRNGGGYIIANSANNFWLETDPKRHVEIFSQANKQHNGDLVPLIKMIKSWNKGNGSFFRSFHLEVLALEALRGVRITDFPSGLRFFFQKAMSLVRGNDPAGYGDDTAVTSLNPRSAKHLRNFKWRSTWRSRPSNTPLAVKPESQLKSGGTSSPTISPPMAETKDLPPAKVRDEIILEAQRLEERTRDSSKAHHCAAEGWNKRTFQLAIPTAIISAITSLAVFAQASKDIWWVGIIAAALSVIVTVLTTLNRVRFPSGRLWRPERHGAYLPPWSLLFYFYQLTPRVILLEFLLVSAAIDEEN